MACPKRIWLYRVCTALCAAGVAAFASASDLTGNGGETAAAIARAEAKTEALPAEGATGSAAILVGAQGAPALRIRGLGQLNVGCANGAPSAVWINRSLVTEIAGVNGSGLSPVLKTLDPGRPVRATLGPAPTTSVWQIGVLSEASRATVTITLSTASRGDSRTCLTVVQAIVTRGQRTQVPTV